MRPGCLLHLLLRGAELTLVILPGPFLTEDELKQAVASLESRARAAERNGLPKTAKSWRDAVENLRPRRRT